jgi:hypothetical protein
MNFFFHNSVKNYTIALLDLFNDIHIPRYNEEGERLQDIVIPIKFGNRDKAYQLDEHEMENLINGNINVLPKMVLEFNSMSKALDRNTNKNQKINKRKVSTDPSALMYEYHYNAVAYDFEFTLYLATRTFSDATMVIEQIAPMFRPDISMKIWELDIQEEPTTVPVAIGDFDITLPDLDPDEIRIVEVSLPITLKGNLYMPIKEAGIIKELEINMINVEAERSLKGIEYELDTFPSVISAKAEDGMTKDDIEDITVTKEDSDITRPSTEEENE